MTFLLTVEGFLLNFAFISWELRDRFDSRCTELNVNVTLLLSLTVSLKIHLFNLNFWTGLTDIYVYLERCTNTAALFYRTQDHVGLRTQVAGLQAQVLILTYWYFRERFFQLLTVTIIKWPRFGIFSFFTGARAHVYKSNSLSSIQFWDSWEWKLSCIPT